ncbi:MAG TPA: hypothetical protein VNU71_13585 [Burkholderiaceae bacterium]|nr:hypothetical protein [Burkholderiaceae bacterium]
MTKPKFLKVGLPVTYLRNGALVRGRVDGTDMKPNGPWVSVNIAPKGLNRVLKRKRPSQLTPA